MNLPEKLQMQPAPSDISASPSANKNNAGKFIFGFVGTLLVATIFMGVTVALANSNIRRAAQRTEADFCTESFVVNERWVHTKKENGRIVQETHLIQPVGEEFMFILPFSAVYGFKTLDRIKSGETIQVKALRQDLADAREGGFIYWFKHGNRRVAAYNITHNGRIILAGEDISRVNEHEAGILENLPRQAMTVGIPIFLIFLAVTIVRQKRKKNVFLADQAPAA